jgi:hypothetical protein
MVTLKHDVKFLEEIKMLAQEAKVFGDGLLLRVDSTSEKAEVLTRAAVEKMEVLARAAGETVEKMEVLARAAGEKADDVIKAAGEKAGETVEKMEVLARAAGEKAGDVSTAAGELFVVSGVFLFAGLVANNICYWSNNNERHAEEGLLTETDQLNLAKVNIHEFLPSFFF